MLGDLKFLDSLREFDKDNIQPANIRRIREKYIANPEFNPDIIKKVSSACEGLCRWVIAIEVYDKVIKVCLVKNNSQLFLTITYKVNYITSNL